MIQSNAVSPLILLVESVDIDGEAWFLEFPLFTGIVCVVRVEDAEVELRGRRMTTMFATNAARHSTSYLRVLAIASRNILVTSAPNRAL